MEKYVNKSDLLSRLKYSSRYNLPCPEWVYNVIEYMPYIEQEDEDVPESK